MKDLSLKEAAERMGVSVRTAWEMLRDGAFPCAWRRTTRGAWRIPVIDVDGARRQRSARPKPRKSSAA